jgi:tryptophan halogenase
LTDRPSRVIVVGSDASVWLTVLTLHAALRRAGVAVEAVVLPPRDQPDDVIEARPAIEALHHRLGVAEDRLLAATRGAFMLGRALVGHPGDPIAFVGYGAHGSPVDGDAFLPHWLRARRAGAGHPLETYNLVASAALQNRMLAPGAEIDAFTRADYGYALPAIAYGRSLERLAQGDRIVSHAANGLEVERDVEGAIRSLRLDGGRHIVGDLFVDVSRDGLLGAAAKAEREPWSVGFAEPRRLCGRLAPALDVPAYGRIDARPWGWMSYTPTPSATFVTVVTAEGEEGPKELSDLGFDLGASEPVARHVLSRPWRQNCVALGPAACRPDPIFGLDLHVLQLGLVHLISRFPVSTDMSWERDDYNGALRSLFANLRDFQGAYYRTQRHEGAPWRAARTRATPPALAHRLALFAARGALGLLEHETISSDEWSALLLGHGLRPETYDPTADRRPLQATESALDVRRDVVARMVAGFPPAAMAATGRRS